MVANCSQRATLEKTLKEKTKLNNSTWIFVYLKTGDVIPAPIEFSFPPRPSHMIKNTMSSSSYKH